MKVVFIEPPKEVWFIMGEYLPPPYGIIQLAAYLEKQVDDVEIEIIDCNAEKTDWKALEERLEKSRPDIVASSSLATCNTYVVARTMETAKKACPDALTVTGGQHFTATAQESMEAYPEIDIIIRGEGERPLTELVKNAGKKENYSGIRGISFRHESIIIHNPSQPLIENLEDLPFPGYHLVKDIVDRYHFEAMAGKGAPYALVEGARGCPHECTFCTQWRHWQGKWRVKSAKRIAQEMDYCNNNFGSEFIWLTDDNFGGGNRPRELAEEILKRDVSKKAKWFVQARCDDIVRNKDVLPKLAASGLNWVLLGIESSEPSVLRDFKKNITPQEAKTAVKLLRDNGIFAQGMFIIGQRKDTVETIARLRDFANDLDPDLAMFAVLTPFPGTEIYEEAKMKGWIEDYNWANYDMIHAIMPTETLSRNEVQEGLFKCYSSFFGSWKRRFGAMFSKNESKRRMFRYMVTRGIFKKFDALVR